MEVLKWLASTFAALLVLSVAVFIYIFATLFVLAIKIIVLGGGAVLFVAYILYELIGSFKRR